MSAISHTAGVARTTPWILSPWWRRVVARTFSELPEYEYGVSPLD